MKLLVGINSYYPYEVNFLTKVLDTYASYTKYDVKVVLATRYPYVYTGDLNILYNTMSYKEGYEYCYVNHEYIFEHYKEYDYVISSDATIIIPEKVVDYYKENEGISTEYIPGVLTYEVDNQGNKVLLAAKRFYRNIITETITIGDKKYVVFYEPHSACFLADQKRFSLAIDKGLSVTPEIELPRTPCDWARDQIYFLFNKLVAVDDILNDNALVWHSTNKYQFLGGKYLTADELFKVNINEIKSIKPRQFASISNNSWANKIIGTQSAKGGCGGCGKKK